MHEPIPVKDQCSSMSDDTADHALLHRMLDETPSFPWTIREFGQEIGDEVAAEDAVCRLVGAGLAHRAGQFVWPTRSARRAQEIELGGI